MDEMTMSLLSIQANGSDVNKIFPDVLCISILYIYMAFVRGFRLLRVMTKHSHQ